MTFLCDEAGRSSISMIYFFLWKLNVLIISTILTTLFQMISVGLSVNFEHEINSITKDLTAQLTRTECIFGDYN